MKIVFKISSLLLLVLLLDGCASEPTRNALPPEFHDTAEVVNLPGIRVWGDEKSQLLHDDVVESIRSEKDGLFPRGLSGELQYANLAISGGGDHGAFGAGYLKGWSNSGTRPIFKIVTGISTGALIAPFAMLGSEYDDILEKAYTTITADDIYKLRFIASSLSSESLADNHPLLNIVNDVISDEVIDVIGQAHKNGQRLFIGTTNFDAQRPVIWNMGAIANSSHPDASRIFREILIASASIPVFFPPVMLSVEADGKVYDEMHVDGGTVGQMFFYGATLDWKKAMRDARGDAETLDQSMLYLIIDGEVDPEIKAVRRRLIPITNRTISTLVKVSAWSSLYRMYLHAQEGGYGFQFTALPDDFVPQSGQPYDPVEMSRMFDIGYDMGLVGNGWRSVPPGF